MSKLYDRRQLLKTLGATTASVGSLGMVSSALANDKINKKFKGRFQSFYGPDADDLHREYIKQIYDLSNGTVDFSYYHGSELVENDQLLSAVQRGVLDIAHGYGGYWPGKIDIGILESGLPGAWQTIDEASYIFDAGGGVDLIRSAYEKQGVYYMRPLLGCSYELLTKKPVNSLDDLKSMKIRASATMAVVLQNIGVKTTYVSTQELYIALSTGTIDGLIYGSPHDYQALKLFEAAKYYTSMGVLYPGVVENIIVNKNFWDGLSDQQRLSIEVASSAFTTRFHNWLVSKSIKVVRQNKESVIYSKLPKKDTEKLLQASRKVWDKQAKKSERNTKFVEIIKNARSENAIEKLR